jgi:hypothetical protein
MINIDKMGLPNKRKHSGKSDMAERFTVPSPHNTLNVSMLVFDTG